MILEYVWCERAQAVYLIGHARACDGPHYAVVRGAYLPSSRCTAGIWVDGLQYATCTLPPGHETRHALSGALPPTNPATLVEWTDADA